MGLFDFVKDAGASIFGGKAEEAVKPAAPAEDPAVRAAANQEAANALAVQIRHLGFRVNELQVQFNAGVATVHGTVGSQREKEIVVLTVGNTKGVAQVDDRMVVEAPEPEAVMYTVKSGDTLSAIAKAHYGNAMKYPQIFEANKPMLTDPDKIYPGQVLRIPPLGS